MGLQWHICWPYSQGSPESTERHQRGSAQARSDEQRSKVRPGPVQQFRSVVVSEVVREVVKASGRSSGTAGAGADADTGTAIASTAGTAGWCRRDVGRLA